MAIMEKIVKPKQKTTENIALSKVCTEKSYF